MASDVLTTLTSFAVSVFRERASTSYGARWHQLLWDSDPLLQEVHKSALLFLEPPSGLSKVTEQVFSQPDLANLAHRENELDPMVLYAGGGSRLPPDALITSLLSATFLQMFFLRLPDDEVTFVQTVLAGFDELRRAAQGERIRAHVITGITGITLPEGAQVSTPWGTLRPAPSVTSTQTFLSVFQPVTTCILTESRLMTVKFDRAPDPQHPVNQSEIMLERSRVLFPLVSTCVS